MKKFISLLLAICICLSMGVMFTACNETDPDNTTVYTVTEDEWKINFNLTKPQSQPQTLACVSDSNAVVKAFSASEQLAAITSYTIYAEGENEGNTGNVLFKMAANAMSIEFYVNGSLKEDETGVYTPTDVLYQSLQANISAFFPFVNNYNDFTFNDADNTYVANNLTSIMYFDYDLTQTYEVYTKNAVVQFVNGYISTMHVEMCDDDFTSVYSTLDFTFSNINNTTVEVV
ncbi:MAG: hypothetical protein E7369_02500 [Clostridiales bacterium]|nr:hypothetical protein [Clostridiales bacterium]